LPDLTLEDFNLNAFFVFKGIIDFFPFRRDNDLTILIGSNLKTCKYFDMLGLENQ